MTRLIEQILHGDAKAVTQFYKMYSPKITRYLSRKLPNHNDAQEITNDVFMEAIESLPLLKQTEKLQSWLYTIAHHKMVDYYRKKKISGLILSQIPYLELVAQEINQPEFQFEKNRIRDGIEHTLHKLSDPYRTILQMHYELDLPVKEVATELNLSFKATESLLFRARKAFQKAYERT